MENYKFVHIGLASDHAGFTMKESLINWLREQGYLIQDFGCHSAEPCDYPDFSHPLAQAISAGKVDIGITLCGSGNGINMVLNKYPAIRSAVCWNREISSLARKHNNANVCSLPARFISSDEAQEIVRIFLETGFEGGRHLRRIDKIPIIQA